MPSSRPSPRLRSWLETAPRGSSKLGLTQLEDRTVPSSSIPLSGLGWKPIGGTIIPAVGTSATPALPVAGRVTGIATPTIPFNAANPGFTGPTDPADLAFASFNTIYAGSPGGGLARSTDSGVTWNFLTDNLPDSAWLNETANRNLKIGALGVSPFNANLILAGTGESSGPDVNSTGTTITGTTGTGILRSTDGGATFNLIQGPGSAFVGSAFEKFVFHPTDPNIIFAVVNDGAPGVYRSLDGGVTWVTVSDNIPTGNGPVFNDLILDPTNPARAFITVSGLGIFRSDNFLNTTGGPQPAPGAITYTLASFNTGTPVPPPTLQFTKLAFGLGTPNQPSRIYAISATDPFNGTTQLFRSDDSGINFRRLDPTPFARGYDAYYNLEILPDPTSPARVFFAKRGANAIQILTNGDFDPDQAQTPNYVNLPLPANDSIRNIRAIRFDNTGAKDVTGRALSPGRLIVATDAGLYRFQAVGGRATTINDFLNPDGNLELVSLNGATGPNALNIQEFYSTALAPRTDNLVLGGTNGNGTARFVDGGPFTVGTPEYNALFSFAPITGADTLGTGQDIAFSQIDPNLVYRVSNYLFESQEQNGGLFQRSTDGGQSWTTSIGGIVRPTTSYPPTTIYNKTAFIADPAPQIGLAESRLFLGTVVVNQSLDGGQNWAQYGPDLPFVTPPPPPGFTQPVVSALGRGLTNTNRIYAGVDNRIGTFPGAPRPSNFGPAIYRYDVPPPGVTPVWVDVSPGVIDGRLPPTQNAPSFPQANDLQGQVVQLIVDPTSAAILYAITNSTGAGRILRSTNSGTSWTDITSNLPGAASTGATGLNVFSIALDPNKLTVNPGSATDPFTQSDDDLYIGTSVGVWKLTNPTNDPITNPSGTFVWNRLAGTGTINNAQTGDPINAGALPDVRVFDVEVNTTTGVLSAATFGRGMWQFQIRPFVRGQLFNDLNGNGSFDKGEVVIAGGVVLAIDNGPAIPNQFANATTATTGEYVFRSLPDSNYTFIPADASTQLIDAATKYYTTGPTVNVDANRFTTVNGQNLFVFDRDDISGVVYVDQNGNGQRDAGELPAVGYIVTLNAPGFGDVAAVATDANGAYVFRGVGPRRNPQGTPGPQVNPAYVVTINKAGTQVTQQPGFIPTLTSGVDITSKQPNLTQVGVFALGTISGAVYEDVNADGVRAPGEQGLAGFVVGLVRPGGQFLANATTDATGAYNFANLTAGSYQLVINPRGGFNPTTSGVITIGTQSGTAVTTANFGEFAAAVISGTLYDDLNGNGLRDANETGIIPNAPVTLFAATTAGLVPVANSVTDGAGNYSFNPVFAAVGVSTFAVQLGGVAGLGQSSGDPTVSPLSNSVNPGQDVGVARAITVSGVAFEDVNGNGLQDASEPGLVAGQVALRNSLTNELIQTVTTDGFGNFVFTGVVPPRFLAPLRVAAPVTGFSQTTPPADFVARSGQPVAGLSIGLFRATSFSGIAARDLNGNGVVDAGEPRLGGRVVQLLNANGGVVDTAVTDANGFYVLSSGPGAFRPFFPVAAGAALTSPLPPLTPTVSGQSIGNQNFAEFQTITISGRVFNDLNGNGSGAGDPGISGILVQVFNAAGAIVAQTRSDAAGNYAIPNLGGGTLRVQPVPPAPFTTPASRTITPASGQNSTLDFGLVTLATVSGRVFRDADRTGTFTAGDQPFAGRTVQLLQNGNPVASTITDANGNYSFGGLAPGSYTVLLLVPGAVSVTGSASRDVTVTSGTAATQDFAVTPSTRYALAADGGGGPRVQVYDQLTGTLLQDFFVYEQSFTGGVRVTTGDVNGDGVDDLIVAPGKGGGPRIRVIDGVTQKVLFDYFAYEDTFRDGLFVTAGDVNGDGFADIITGTEAGGGPRVTVFDGKSGGIVADYFAYDANFRGGVRVGSGDITGTGLASVLTAPGVGGGPNVVAWAIPGGGQQPVAQISFNAFPEGYTGGVYVAAAPTGPGGQSNIVVGSGQLQPAAGVSLAVVRVFTPDGQGLISETEAFPGGVDPAGYKSEVRVASFDRTGDGVPDLALASGPGNYPRVRFLDGVTRRQVGEELQPYEFAFTGGIFVG